MIDAGLATYVECRERLTLDEVITLNEVLLARVENEWRAHEAAQRKSKEKR